MPDEPIVNVPVKSVAGRSVSYPFISLEEAVGRARVLWENEGKNFAYVSAAVSHWGYAPKSSGGRQTVAALKAFGLVEDQGESEGRQIRLTERALDILLEPDQSKKMQALRAAAISPKVYGELLNKWVASELPSDPTISAFLLREKDFNRNAVADFIKDFRANIAYSGLADSLKMPPTTSPPTFSEPPLPSPIRIGSYVQWEPNGVWQFSEPRKVTGFSDDGDYLFVEGSLTGVPLNEVTVMSEPSATVPLSAPTAVTPPAISRPPSGSRQDTFSLDEGMVILQWPATLSSDSYEDFESWIQLQLKKIKRSVAK